MKDIRQNWKALAAARNIQSRDIFALCIYRSIYKEEGKAGAISRIKKSFSPLANPRRLSNGAKPYFALQWARQCIRGSVVLTWIDEADKLAMLDIAKEININGTDIT